MSGEARLVTMPEPSAANFAAGSDGARFSTLYVAIDSCFLLPGVAVTGARLLCWTVPSALAWIV